MIRELNDAGKYPKLMLVLSALTFVSGMAYCLIGELVLPFAVAFCAALFIFEKPEKRILSFLIPLSVIVIAVIVGGWCSFVFIEFVLLALILALSYRFGLSKGECAIYMSVTAFIFFVISLYLSAASEIGSFALSDVAGYYRDAVNMLREYVIESFEASNNVSNQINGKIGSVITTETVAQYFDTVVSLLVAIFAIAAFAISGIAIKLFTAISLRECKNGILKSFAHFLPSKMLAYTYVAVSIVTAFLSLSGTFAIALINTSEILMAVFFYVGFRYASVLSEMFARRTTFIFILAAAFLIAPGVAIQVISYLGAWFVISVHPTSEIK